MTVSIAKGTLYYHFPSSEQILKALVLRIVHQVASRLRETLPHQPHGGRQPRSDHERDEAGGHRDRVVDRSTRRQRGAPPCCPSR